MGSAPNDDVDLPGSAFHQLLRQLGEEHDRVVKEGIDKVETLLQEKAKLEEAKNAAADTRPPPLVASEVSKQESSIGGERKTPKGPRAVMGRQAAMGRSETKDLGGSSLMLQQMGPPTKGTLQKARGGGGVAAMGRQAALGRGQSGEEVLMRQTSSGTEVRSFTSADALAKLRAEALHNKAPKSDELPRDYVKLHPQWLLDTEAINIAGGFAFALPSTIAVKANRLLSPEQQAFRRRKGCCFGLLPECELLERFGTYLQLMWDFMGIVCILVDLIWIPVQIGFNVPTSDALSNVEWFIRIFWTLDVVVKIRQLYRSLDAYELRSARVLVYALGQSGWLFFDIMIVVVDWLPVLVTQNEDGSVNIFGLLRIGKVPRILRILRVLRLARMMRLEHFFFALRDSLLVSSESVSLTLGVLKNMVFILLLCHICTCVWFFVGTGDTDDHWVPHFGVDTKPLMEQYLWSFHWVAAQWTPAAMEVLPQNSGERFFNAMLVVAGVGTWSTFMGAITASMTRLRNLSGNELTHFFLLRHYLYENGISRSLTVRICRYADLALEMHRKRINQESVRHLKLLSGPLHVELQKEIYLPHLNKHLFFAGYTDWDMAAMSQLCFTALGREFVAKGDILFSLGAESFRMYCPVSGTFIYQRRRGVTVPKGSVRPKRTARVGIGTWFCEACLWVKWHHLGSMCALIESETVQVDANKFREVTVHRESVFSRSALYARAYSRTMYDEHGYAWDVPAELLYHSEDHHHHYWWQREVVDAEIEEAKWLAAHVDSESDDEDHDGSGSGSFEEVILHAEDDDYNCCEEDEDEDEDSGIETTKTSL